MFPELTRDDVFRLETRRLWLRWPRAADAAALKAPAASDVLRQAVEAAQTAPVALQADALILAARRDNAEGAALNLVLARRSRPQEAIGMIMLAPGATRRAARLGFWLAPDERGEGLMAEAVESLLALVFDLCDLAGVESEAREDDEAAALLLRRVGFAPADAEKSDGGPLLWRLDRAAFARPFRHAAGSMKTDRAAAELAQPV